MSFMKLRTFFPEEDIAVVVSMDCSSAVLRYIVVIVFINNSFTHLIQGDLTGAGAVL